MYVTGHNAEFRRGDLVIFTGFLYTPDFMYTDNYGDTRYLGIVLGPAGALSYGAAYNVYWFNRGNCTYTVSSHLRLAYVTTASSQA